MEFCKRRNNLKGDFAEMEKKLNFSVGNMNNIHIAVIDKKGQWRAICVSFYICFFLHCNLCCSLYPRLWLFYYQSLYKNTLGGIYNGTKKKIFNATHLCTNRNDISNFNRTYLFSPIWELSKSSCTQF